MNKFNVGEQVAHEFTSDKFREVLETKQFGGDGYYYKFTSPLTKSGFVWCSERWLKCRSSV